jgi:hypothetical protein
MLVSRLLLFNVRLHGSPEASYHRRATPAR